MTPMQGLIIKLSRVGIRSRGGFRGKDCPKDACSSYPYDDGNHADANFACNRDGRRGQINRMGMLDLQVSKESMSDCKVRHVLRGAIYTRLGVSCLSADCKLAKSALALRCPRS